jgi:hypothetical protein
LSTVVIDLDRVAERFAPVFADVLDQEGPVEANGLLYILFELLECEADAHEHA